MILLIVELNTKDASLPHITLVTSTVSTSIVGLNEGGHTQGNIL
jgi:hypothetical protein